MVHPDWPLYSTDCRSEYKVIRNHSPAVSAPAVASSASCGSLCRSSRIPLALYCRYWSGGGLSLVLWSYVLSFWGCFRWVLFWSVTRPIRLLPSALHSQWYCFRFSELPSHPSMHCFYPSDWSASVMAASQSPLTTLSLVVSSHTPAWAVCFRDRCFLSWESWSQFWRSRAGSRVSWRCFLVWRCVRWDLASRCWVLVLRREEAMACLRCRCWLLRVWICFCGFVRVVPWDWT